MNSLCRCYIVGSHPSETTSVIGASVDKRIDRISPEMKEKIGNLSFQNYRPTKKNILVIGPVPGKKYSEITFPILSPDPASNKDAHFLKYPIYVGGNRGRGQIYPDGNKSNNTVYNATATGIVSKIIRKEKGGYEITITDALDGHQVVDIIPPGPELLVSEGESIKLDRSIWNYYPMRSPYFLPG